MNRVYRNAIDRTPHFEPGEVVWANVFNPQENRSCQGKPRPAILLERRRNGWLVMGLTSNPAHLDGTCRVRIEAPEALGLRRDARSHLWGTPTFITAPDVWDHIGWVDEVTAEALAGNPTVPVSVEILLGEDGDDGWALAT